MMSFKHVQKTNIRKKITFIYITCAVFFVLVPVAGSWAPKKILADKTNVPKVPNENGLKEVRQYLRRDVGNIDGINDHNDFMTFYKLRTFKNMRRALAVPALMWVGDLVRNVIKGGENILRSKGIPKKKDDIESGRFTGGRCNCTRVVCACCSYIHLFGFYNETCTRLKYDPTKGTVNLHINTPNDELNHYSTFEVNQAKTRCYPFPLPYLELGSIDMCIGFYNVTKPQPGLLHLCMAVTVRINKQAAMTLYYDCMDLGKNAMQYGESYDYPIINKPGPENDYFPSTSPDPPSDEEPWNTHDFRKKKHRQHTDVPSSP